jgi:hypothetical protein
MNLEKKPNDAFKERMSGPIGTEVVGICHLCAHKHEGKFTCRAFPKGIPDVILTGDYDHHNPFIGDHGITFKDKE